MKIQALEPDVRGVLATFLLVCDALIGFDIVRPWAYLGFARLGAAGA